MSDFFPNVRPIAALKTRVWVAQGRLGEALGWARERGLKRVGLWAPASEPAAIALYFRAGFKDTGRHRPFPNKADLRISEMEIEL